MTSSTPRLSIIIATWNAARTLERCLSSIMDQEFRDWELLIADGGSIDGTVDMIGKYEERISWWQSQLDSGIYDAWNQALVHADGDYICFIGADDFFADQDSLLTISRAAAEGNQDIVSAKGILVDDDGFPLGEVGREWNHKALRRRIGICHPGAWFRHDLFDSYGTFDLSYKIVADYEWLLRLPENTTSMFVDRATINIGHGGMSRTHVWRRLRERRIAHTHCPRIGPVRAYAYWLDKMWRWPIAKLFGLQF